MDFRIKAFCKKHINKTNLFYFAIILIGCLGLFLRAKAMFAVYPFWMDESSLAINVIKRNIFELFLPLEHYQSAPPLFLALTKIITYLLGEKEFSFRLIPFLTSIASIPIFFIFIKKILVNKISIIFAFLLFCLNYQLIYFSIEFKQYSLDVFVCMVAFLLFSKINIKNLSKTKIFLYGFCCALSLLLCLPFTFLFGASILYEIFINKIKFKKAFIFLIPSLIIFPLYYFYNLLPSKIAMLSLFSDLWSGGFINSFHNFISIFKHNIIFYFSSKSVLIYLALYICAFYFLIKEYKEKQRKDIFLILFFFLAILLASIFHIYPFKERVALYALPFFILVLGFLIDKIINKNKFRKIISGLIIFILILPYINLYQSGIYNKIENKKSYARDLFAVLNENYSNDEIVIYNDASASNYEYYSHYFNFSTDKFVQINLVKHDKLFYTNLLNYLHKNRVYWFYFCADYIKNPVVPFIKEWTQNQIVLKEYKFKKGYLAKIKVIN